MKKYLFALILITSMTHAMDKHILSQEDRDRIVAEALQIANNISIAELEQSKKIGQESKIVIRDVKEMKRELHETGQILKTLSLIHSNLKEGNIERNENRSHMIGDLLASNRENTAIHTALSAAVEFEKSSKKYIDLLRQIRNHPDSK